MSNRGMVFATLPEERAYENNDTHLWMAVMDRAVRDLVALERYRKDPKVMDDPVFRYDYRTLKKWFHSPSMEPGAFNWICSLVGVDPKWALSRIEERLEAGLVIADKGVAAKDDLVASAA